MVDLPDPRPLMDEVVDGAVDHEGLPVRRPTSGGWKSASFIIAVEVAERFAYYGISSNLITYLTGTLGQSTATAAVNVNSWSGTASMLPLLGAFVADAYLGRYRTIVFASLIYILGLGLLTLSALLTSLSTVDCYTQNQVTKCSFKFSDTLFLISLYLVALGQGGHKPCVQAFGADQFDGGHPKENIAKSSFFNWWSFSLSIGIMVSLLVVVYIEDNISWALGFGVVCILMLVALVIFLIGTRTYRYYFVRKSDNPFARIGRVFVSAVKNRILGIELRPSDDMGHSGKKITHDDIEDAKALLRLIPICTTCLVYGIVYAQASTFFTKQGATMDRTIFPGVVMPAASLQFFIGVAIIVLVPTYDIIFVPIARALSGNPTGITMLQRIGMGILFSAVSMIVSAVVEIKRLKAAAEYGLVDNPNATVPMSIWWLVPQYLLFGVADVFTLVGLQEFLYDQVPKELRSLGLSLYLTIIGVGSFLSSILVSIIDETTGRDGGDSWFDSNLNRAHLDYFYWLLAGSSLLALFAYLYFARSFTYIRCSS